MPNQYVLFELDLALRVLVAAVKSGALLLGSGLLLMTCGLFLIAAAVRLIQWLSSEVRRPVDSVFPIVRQRPRLFVLPRMEAPTGGIVRTSPAVPDLTTEKAARARGHQRAAPDRRRGRIC